MFNEQIRFSLKRLPIRISPRLVEHHADERFPIHHHDEFEFLLMVRGEMLCEIDDTKYILKKGDVIFVNGRVPHMTQTLEEGTIYLLLNIGMPSSGKGPLRYILKFLKNSNSPCYHFKNGTSENRDIYQYIMKMYDENREKKNGYEFYMEAYMHMILALLHRMDILCDESHIGDHKAIEKIMPVLEFVDKNFAEQITLDTISEMLNFNKSYLCRLFKSATNSTFTEYLNFVRICKSEKLLKQGENISEVAYAVGFSSLSYFNRTFKKYKRCSPSMYKKLISKRGSYEYTNA